jgi:WS/DGAT/MGAT family acyltransferase
VQQLSGLDASFLHMETASTYGHVSSVALFDASGAEGRLDFDAVKELLEARLHLLPPYRRRLIEVPFGLDHPYWIEDPDFDLDFHVRHIALPRPGNRHQLAEQVARLAARPLDRSRPLWELYLIEGLENGLVAQFTKIHHCAIDGVSGAEIMTTLLDLAPEPREVPRPRRAWKPDRVPGQLEMLGRGALALASQPRKALRFQRRVLSGLGLRAGIRSLPTVAALPALANLGALAVPALEGLMRRAPQGDGGLLEQPEREAPRVSFNRTITPHRRWAYGSLSLEDVKAVKKAFGTTVNDVVMALCAGALRRFLRERHELPKKPLLAMVPVSVRTEEEKGKLGNRVSAMVAVLPTHVESPTERLRLAHEAMKAAKEQHNAMPAELLQDFSQFAMPAIAARAARVIARTKIADRVKPPFNVVISNVPGPQFPLYCNGARMVGVYPVSAIADGVGLNITVLSYLGSLDFGLLACRELVPDIWDLMGYLGDELKALREAARAA